MSKEIATEIKVVDIVLGGSLEGGPIRPSKDFPSASTCGAGASAQFAYYESPSAPALFAHYVNLPPAMRLASERAIYFAWAH